LGEKKNVESSGRCKGKGKKKYGKQVSLVPDGGAFAGSIVAGERGKKSGEDYRGGNKTGQASGDQGTKFRMKGGELKKKVCREPRH